MTALALAAPGAACAQARAGDLFVLTAASGKIKAVPGGAGTFQLALRRPDRDVTVFADRPERSANQQELPEFVQGWDGLGFGAVPPNAALVVERAPQDRDVTVFELSQPRLTSRGRTLAFLAKMVQFFSGTFDIQTTSPGP